MKEHQHMSVEEVCERFRQAGIIIPRIASYKGKMNQYGKLFYSTRDEPTPNPYNMPWYIEDLENPKSPPYVLLGHGGHGANSYGFHYYHVEESFALFVQVPWGGLYSDREADTAYLTAEMKAAEALIYFFQANLECIGLFNDSRIVITASWFDSHMMIGGQIGGQGHPIKWDRKRAEKYDVKKHSLRELIEDLKSVVVVTL